MASPLTVSRNDYITNPKRQDVPTPVWLCEFIASLFPDVSTVFDPACGDGRLLAPFSARANTIGHEIKNGRNFLIEKERIDCDLVVCNPPFNLGTGKMLGSEAFYRKIIERCGNVQTVLFAPMGFRLNQRQSSQRWRWLRDASGHISSIISLHIDTFENVQFHSEIIVFNAPHLKPHYFPPKEFLR